MFRRICGYPLSLLALRFAPIPAFFYSYSVYVRDAHLDIAYSFSLTTYVTCPKKNNLCNLTYYLQWENIDKIKEFNWNFENLRGMVTDHNLVNSLCFLNVLPLQ